MINNHEAKEGIQAVLNDGALQILKQNLRLVGYGDDIEIEQVTNEGSNYMPQLIISGF